MFLRLFFLLQIILPAGLNAQEKDWFNFDPDEKLLISTDSIDLKKFLFEDCLKTRTVYPLEAAVPLIKNLGDHPQVVKIQECFFPNTERRQKLVIVTYYDLKKKIKTPIAFVYAVKKKSLSTKDKTKYSERWAKADLGFIKNGVTNRSWATLLPEKNKKVQDKLINLLLPGFNKAINIK